MIAYVAVFRLTRKRSVNAVLWENEKLVTFVAK